VMCCDPRAVLDVSVGSVVPASAPLVQTLMSRGIISAFPVLQAGIGDR
jgi:hypothetical protein